MMDVELYYYKVSYCDEKIERKVFCGVGFGELAFKICISEIAKKKIIISVNNDKYFKKMFKVLREELSYHDNVFNIIFKKYTYDYDFLRKICLQDIKEIINEKFNKKGNEISFPIPTDLTILQKLEIKRKESGLSIKEENKIKKIRKRLSLRYAYDFGKIDSMTISSIF